MLKGSTMSKVENGQTVNVHYIGTLDDGTQFDASRPRGQTLTFEVGSGQMIPGFDKAMVGMMVGETKTIALGPTEAYGDINPEAFQSAPRTTFPEGFQFVVNETVKGQDEAGHVISARIHTLEETTVTLDFNHPLAGKNLNFEIELVSVDE
jgi:peptidylprolyl isomerase